MERARCPRGWITACGVLLGWRLTGALRRRPRHPVHLPATPAASIHTAVGELRSHQPNGRGSSAVRSHVRVSGLDLRGGRPRCPQNPWAKRTTAGHDGQVAGAVIGAPPGGVLGRGGSARLGAGVAADDAGELSAGGGCLELVGEAGERGVADASSLPAGADGQCRRLPGHVRDPVPGCSGLRPHRCGRAAPSLRAADRPPRGG